MNPKNLSTLFKDTHSKMYKGIVRNIYFYITNIVIMIGK